MGEGRVEVKAHRLITAVKKWLHFEPIVLRSVVWFANSQFIEFKKCEVAQNAAHVSSRSFNTIITFIRQD